MSNSNQIRSINGVRSQSIENKHGVPHSGSILGTLLFSIYITHIPQILTGSEITLYADDTLVYTIWDAKEQCTNKLKNNMDNINVWLKINESKLNEIKTKIIEINMTSETEFKINEKIIDI